MNLLVVVGSPRKKGNTNTLVNEFLLQSLYRGVNCEVMYLYEGGMKIDPCYHCKRCYDTYECIVRDSITETLKNMKNYDGIVFASPVYFYSFSAKTKAFLDRLYSVDLKDKKLATIITSGSDFFEGGCDLVVEMMKRTSKYCGSEWIGAVQKTTNDLILPLDREDVTNIGKLIDSFLGEEVLTKCFIRD